MTIRLFSDPLSANRVGSGPFPAIGLARFGMHSMPYFLDGNAPLP